jgi:hypothetical protein
MSDKDDVFAYFKKAAGEPEPEALRNTAGGEPEPTDDEDEPYVLPPLRPQKYTAFRLGKRRERLLIDRAAQPMRFPAYHELRDISFDQAQQQGFHLFFQAMTVEVIGKNLWPVVHAISSGRCAAVYEYHAKLYPAPPAKGEPFIESIKLLPPEALADD